VTIRRTTFYVMLGLQVVSVFALLIVAGVVWDTRNDTTGTIRNLSIGCGRANKTRGALHWLALNVPGVPPPPLPGLTLTPPETPDPDKPWLVDCDAAYP